MQNWDIVSVSSKGQMVIPQKVREFLNIHDGERLKITTAQNAFIVKKFADERKDLLEAARHISEDVRKKGLKKSDLKKMIEESRKISRRVKN